jgi:hypothetical protein
MRKILTGCAAMLFAGAAAGQILECVDAKGHKEFASVCPPGTTNEKKVMKGGTAPSAAPAGKSLSERDAEFKKRQVERQENETKAAKESAESKDKERNCADARSQLRALQEGQRISRVDPGSGERSFLEDKDRPAEVANAQKAVDNWCKK